MAHKLSTTGRTRRRFVWIGLLVVLCVALAVVVGAMLVSSRGNDTSATPADRKSVTVVIAGTNDAEQEVTDGGIAGRGTFRATGAIEDRGTVTAYRSRTGPNDSVIVLRFVTKGSKGGITYRVRIENPVTSRWRVQAATGAYGGLHGSGDESENETYTVSTLRGTVWR
jgi:hypothetical protein